MPEKKEGNMGVQARQNSTDSPKAEVGEIDTRAPFQSVKAAVSLFGEGVFGVDKQLTEKNPKLPPAERKMAKERQLHLAKKELDKFKEQLKNAETTQTQALAELEQSKITVLDLTNKLKTIAESKESAIRVIEASRIQVQQLESASSREVAAGNSSAWKFELDEARESYRTALSELEAAKLELRKIRRDFVARMDAKSAAFRRAAKAEQAFEVNSERAGELSLEIAATHDTLMHTKLACSKVEQERANIVAEREACQRSSKLEVAIKLENLKKGFDRELARNLETKLAATTAEIRDLEKEMEAVRVNQLDSLRNVTKELDDAKEALKKLADEESSLRKMVETLKQDLDTMRKEHYEVKQKEAETENVAGNLHVKLLRSNAELEHALAAESKIQSAFDELVAALRQLSSETGEAKRGAEEMRQSAEELKNEAEVARIAIEVAEKKLKVAMREVEEAKTAEARSRGQIKALSEKTNAVRVLTSESGAEISISPEEYENLSRKVEESDTLAGMKVEAAMALVEAVKASENEATKRLEACWKEIEEAQKETAAALKRTEMAEAAKRVVEGELRRWRERDQKLAAEAAARILPDVNVSSEMETGVHVVKAQMPEKLDGGRKVKTKLPEKLDGTRKVDRATTMKKTLLTNLSGIFQRKKNQVEVGSPSYIPGEKTV